MILTVSFKESDKRINTEFKEIYRVIPEGYLRPTGTLTITDNGEHNVRKFESVNVEVPIPEGYIVPDGILKVYDVGNYDVTTYAKASFSVPTEEKTFTPTKEAQEYAPEMGYITKVVVESIPEEYIIPAGEFSVDENGSYDITEYASINVNVPIPEGYLVPEGIFAADVEGSYDVTPYAEAVFTVQREQVSVTPTEETQTLVPTENKFFDQIVVEPIPEAYLIPEGTLEVATEGVYDVTSYASVQVDVETEEVFATPTEEAQIFTPGENKFIDKVVVNPIPGEYLIPEGTFETNIEGTYDVTPYANATFSVQKEELNVTPSSDIQTLTPSENKFYNKVVVQPIPSDYIVPSGTLEVTENGEVDVTKYAKANVNIDTAKPEQSKSTVPTKNTQTILPDEGYVLNEVIVNPIPEEYIVPEGTLDITENGKVDITKYQYVDVDVPDIPAVLQEKSITPKKEIQYLTPDSGYEGMSKVTIEPIPDEYIIPEGTLDITENGEYNVTDKASVNVNINASSGEDMLQTRVNITKICDYLFYNYGGNRIDYIANLDTSNVTSMINMFRSCKGLTTIPLLNTSSVTIMNEMFYSCTALTSIPLFDTSKVASMTSMFYNCSALISIPQLNTSKVGNMGNMFSNCRALTSIPQLDTSNVTNMASMFYNCSALTSIPQLNTSKANSMSNIFYGCTSLKSILMYGMKVDLNISASTQFETEDLVIILNNLATVRVTRTLTMGATNLAKLSDEQKLIATNKGWTLA